MPRSFSRRRILRGLGAAVALPWLESNPVLASAPDEPSRRAPPVRTAFFYVPNGKLMTAWRPAETGSEFQLPETLRPLAKFQEKLLVLSGLTLDSARPHGNGPGDHARAMASFLTCRPARKTAGVPEVGASIDQLLARQFGEATRFPSLELGIEPSVQAGNCDAGYSCAYVSNISWRTPSIPAPKEIHPEAVFDRLFSEGGLDDRDAARARRLANRQSVLDFVLEDARRLQGRISARDAQRLDEYFSNLRAVERRLTAFRQSRGRTPEELGLARPPALPDDYTAHVRMMFDLVALAFETDQTRVASFAFANAGSNRFYPQAGVSGGHHELSHHSGNRDKQADFVKVNRLHVQLFADLLAKLDSISEEQGTLLDHCQLIYGSGISDGNYHTHDNLPILLAGGGGGAWETGRHVVYPAETPLANLYLALAQRLGLEMNRFGDSTGRLPRLD